MRELYKTMKFYTIQLPLILFAISAGLIFEFIITFPFLIFCSLDRIDPMAKNKENSAGED